MNLTSESSFFTRPTGYPLDVRRVSKFLICPSNVFSEEFVLRILNASPLINPFLTPEFHGSYVFIDDIYSVALSRKDVGLLDYHIRDKRISCNLTAEKHEITSYKIHGSHVFIDSIYLALCHDILQLIRAGKPKQMPQNYNSIPNGI